MTNGRVTRLQGLDPLLAEDFRLLDQYANTAQVAKQVSYSMRTVCALPPDALMPVSIPPEVMRPLQSGECCVAALYSGTHHTEIQTSSLLHVTGLQYRARHVQ